MPPSSFSGDRVESLSCSLVMIPATILTFPLFLLFFLFFLFSLAAVSWSTARQGQAAYRWSWAWQ